MSVGKETVMFRTVWVSKKLYVDITFCKIFMKKRRLDTTHDCVDEL